MKNWGKMLGLLVLLAAGVAVVMSDIYVSGTWRYKMTVEVETPEGIKTGSAVHELSGSDSSIKILDLPEVGNPPDFKGEAVVVDLGKRGVVFAILPTNPYYMFYQTFYGPRAGATTIEGIKYFNGLPTGLKKEIAGPEYPRFVMFEDINDPKSVRAVKETRFAEILGEGVKLKSITLEITDEPVTWGIVDKSLPTKLLIGFNEWWEPLSMEEKMRLSSLFNFKQGDR